MLSVIWDKTENEEFITDCAFSKHFDSDLRVS